MKDVKHYYEDNSIIFKLEGRLHKKIILYNRNYKMHIKISHPEISMNKIEEILTNPDYVYKSSRKSSVLYYEKKFGEDIFRVVIGRHKKSVKVVITAYKVCGKDPFTIKHVHCLYDKQTYINYEDMQNQLEDDIDYFYDLFGVAK